MDWAWIAAGALQIALFAYSNFRLDDMWAGLLPADVHGASRRHGGTLRGIVETTLFVAGVALVAAGFASIGIGLGYGGF